MVLTELGPPKKRAKYSRCLPKLPFTVVGVIPHLAAVNEKDESMGKAKPFVVGGG